jgi:hypothetical protein
MTLFIKLLCSSSQTQAGYYLPEKDNKRLREEKGR